MTTTDLLLRSFELDQYFFCGLMAIYSYCCEFGRQVKNSPQQTGLLLLREAEGSDFTYIIKISLWAFFAPSLASSCLICMAASNFWINPAECELLCSALGDRLLLLQVTCVWDEGWILKRTLLLSLKKSTHSCQEWADKPAEILGTKVFYCPFESFKSLCREQLNTVWTHNITAGP